MADTPQVSIVIAAYNVAGYIERAIRSALDQQGVTVEVIVIDDGSRDRTVEIASAMNDSRVIIKQLPGNGGPGVARNTGFALARAPWIAVLDGDDALQSHRLARLLQLAQARQADIVIDNLTAVREADGARSPFFPPKVFNRHATLDLARFIRGNRLLWDKAALGYVKPVFATAFLRRHKLAYETDIRIGEDYLLLAAALACGAVCAVDGAAGYEYTIRQGSISHRLSPEAITRMIAGGQHFARRYPLTGNAARAQRSYMFSLYEQQAFTRLVAALKRRDFKTALAITLKRPTAPLHLWEAVWVRVKRLLTR